MSSGDLTRYVVTVKIHEASLTELNELNNAFSQAKFLLTLTDEEGNTHDLGPMTFGLISPLDSNDVKALASSLAEGVTDKAIAIEVDTWEAWHKKEH